MEWCDTGVKRHGFHRYVVCVVLNMGLVCSERQEIGVLWGRVSSGYIHLLSQPRVTHTHTHINPKPNPSLLVYGDCSGSSSPEVIFLLRNWLQALCTAQESYYTRPAFTHTTPEDSTAFVHTTPVSDPQGYTAFTHTHN